MVNNALLADLNNVDVILNQVNGQTQFQETYVNSDGTSDIGIYTSLGIGNCWACVCYIHCVNNRLE